jgi:hypothetical protein
VDEVIDTIEDLRVSMHDDELRWKTYYTIYRNPKGSLGIDNQLVVEKKGRTQSRR